MYEYKIVHGDQYHFETEINELSKKGWLTVSPMTTVVIEGYVGFSVLMMHLVLTNNTEDK